MRGSLRRGAVSGVLLLTSTLQQGITPVAAQDPSGPLCLLTSDEMAELVGTPIAAIDAIELECAYTADPAVRSLQVVLGIVPMDPFGPPPGDDGLTTIRRDHVANGQDAAIAGLPAWVADDGAWVDVGPDVLSVWLNTVFDDDPPPLPDTASAIAAIAVPRYLADPRPSAAPRTGLAARFPTVLAHEDLEVDPMAASDLFALVAEQGSPGGGHPTELRAAIADLGVAEDALEVASSSVFDIDAGYFGILAIRAPGADVRSLLEPAIRVFAGTSAARSGSRTIAGHEVVLVPPQDGSDDPSRWFTADGDVVWMLEGAESLVHELLAALPTVEAG